MKDLYILLGFAVAGLATGTLVEYVVHRFVAHSKRRWFVTRRHVKHHKSNAADTVWGDFRDFVPFILPVAWMGFLFGAWAGVGFLTGCIGYVLVLAAVHKWSHECPRLVFWMNPNAHELHHARTPKANYGVTTSFWDRIFGTYTGPKA